MKRTPEQEAIIDFGVTAKESGLIDAVAGSSKTTTGVWMTQAINPMQGQMLCLAFNVSIKKVLEAKMPKGCTVMTLNGLGHRAWTGFINQKITLDEGKMGKLISETLKSSEWKDSEDRDDLWQDSLDLANAARTHGVVIGENPVKGLKTNSFYPDDESTWDMLFDFIGASYDERVLTIARWALEKSVKQAFTGLIDFSDQIYMSCCFGGKWPKFDLVFVDEAQDLSALNHFMLRKVTKNRLIAVGDPYQSIYAFRGATQDSMKKLGEDFAAKVLPLTVCFRCSRKVVEEAQKVVPHIQAWDQSPIGKVEFLKDWTIDTLPPSAAVICRNNAPLISLAYKLLREGRGFNMIGRDFGKGLKRLVEKITKGENLNGAALRKTILDWQFMEITNARIKGKEHKVAGIQDRAMSLLALANGGDKNALIKKIERIFDVNSGPLTLSSIHRFKGREEHHVYFLDSFLVPSNFAVQAAEEGDDRQLLQENNLLYVARTRAIESLTYINTKGLKGGEE